MLNEKTVTELNVYKLRLKKGSKWTIDARPVGIQNVKFGRYVEKADALKAMIELCRAFNGHGKIQTAKKTKVKTLGQAMDDYLSVQETKMTESYYRAQKFNLGLLKAAKFKNIECGYWNIATLASKSEREDFRQFVEDLILDEGRSIETMFTRRKHMTKFFEAAAKKGWVDANPISDIKLPKKKPTDDRAPKVQQDFVRWLQTDGLDAYGVAYSKAAEKVLATGRKKYRKRNHLTITPRRLEIMMLLSMTTGIRQGELRALRRCDYLVNQQKIITRQAVKHGTKDFGDIKTMEGQDREIEVPFEVCKMLTDYLQDSKFQEYDDLIFPSTTGTPLRKNDFCEAVKPIREACPFKDKDTGLPLHFKWGDLRHAFASVMIDQLGANWPEVAESMGHTNPEFTKKQYGHYIEDEEKSKRKRDAAGAVLVNRKGR